MTYDPLEHTSKIRATYIRPGHVVTFPDEHTEREIVGVVLEVRTPPAQVGQHRDDNGTGWVHMSRRRHDFLIDGTWHTFDTRDQVHVLGHWHPNAAAELDRIHTETLDAVFPRVGPYVNGEEPT